MNSMKWLIASDLHGSALYTKMLLMRFEAEHADRMLLLGDLLYHGPRNDLPDGYAPKDVIAMLNERRDSILCVRGNCEAEVDQMVLAFPVLADYALFSLGTRMIFATHGHIYNEQHLPPLRAGDILLHGHTHVPACREHETYTYLNPGSVSMPKEGSPHSYMLREDGCFIWKTLEGEEYRRWDANQAEAR